MDDKLSSGQPLPQQSASSQDCSTCKRRRIKCDRAAPGCQKCRKRGYQCPGYDTRIHWVNDAATRGRMKGLQATQTNHIPEHVQSVVSHDAPDFTWNQLRRYYEEKIARLMVWIDSPENLYRTYITEMASEWPVLRLAISAAAAQHWNTTGHSEMIPLPGSFRDEAIMGITASVKGILDNSYQLTLVDAQWMLASMLVLSCCDLIQEGAEAADWHRRAARRLVGVIKTMDWCHDRLISFLINQLAIYDILSCTTSFDVSNIQEAILPMFHNGNPLFAKILLVIHDVTLHRGQNGPPARNNSRELGHDQSKALLTIRNEIELARGETILVAGALGIQDPKEQRDFIRLVDLYCKATLLYAHRIYPRGHTSQDAHIIEDMFSVLDEIEKPESIQHNLPWPLFIAGTECHGNAKRQQQIITQFKGVHKNSGSDHYEELVEFLTSFWAGENDNWQDRASEREPLGLRILAV